MERNLSDMGRSCYTIQVGWILTVIMTAAHAGLGQSRTHIVSGERSLNIQQALKRAVDVDTIRIMPGTYRECNLVVQKAVTIEGVGIPVIDGENKYEIFTIAANDVTISGLRLINTGVASINDISAINALGAKRLRVLNNQLENAFFGIHLSNCYGSLIEGNTLRADSKSEHQIGNGIHAWKCD